MGYSLCGVPLRVVCIPPSETGSLTRILERLFSLLPLYQPPAADTMGISIRVVPSPEPPADDVSGELVFESPGLSAMRTRLDTIFSRADLP
jgi:hypothetical protein